MSFAVSDREKDKFEEINGQTVVKVVPKNIGSLLEGLAFDYIAAAYPTSTTETYSYYSGGSGGTIVATITVAYTNPSKHILLSVERS